MNKTPSEAAQLIRELIPLVKDAKAEVVVCPTYVCLPAAAEALAGLISDEERNADYIIPAAFDPRVGRTVAAAVAQAARDSGVARI